MHISLAGPALVNQAATIDVVDVSYGFSVFVMLGVAERLLASHV